MAPVTTNIYNYNYDFRISLEYREIEIFRYCCFGDIFIIIHFYFSECMGVREVKPIFHKNDESIGARDCMVLPTSGLTGDGVEEGINWLVDCLKRNASIRPPRGNEDN